MNKTDICKITTDDDFMETKQHGDRHYPFQFYKEDISWFDFYCIDWHWHTELEFMYVETGNVRAWIGDKELEITAGNAIFVNSRIMHRFQSEADASIPNFLFMPDLIAPMDSRIYEKYVKPIIDSTLTYQIFDKEIAWQAEAIEMIRKIVGVQEEKDCELATSACIQRLWLLLYENADFQTLKKDTDKSAISLARLQLIMQYIHTNYQKNVSLDEMADYAGVSKSTVLNLFRQYLHTSPVSYMINYRLKEAAWLLLKTEKKVSVISQETGFKGVDYFCRTFKEYYHMTPTQYRDKAKSEHTKYSRGKKILDS